MTNSPLYKEKFSHQPGHILRKIPDRLQTLGILLRIPGSSGAGRSHIPVSGTRNSKPIDEEPQQKLREGHVVPGPAGHGDRPAYFAGEKFVVPVSDEGGPIQEGHHLGHDRT